MYGTNNQLASVNLFQTFNLMMEGTIASSHYMNRNDSAFKKDSLCMCCVTLLYALC